MDPRRRRWLDSRCATSTPIPPAPMIATLTPAGSSRVARQQLRVADHVRQIGARDRHRRGRHAGRHDDRVERRQRGGVVHPHAEPDVDPQRRQLGLEVLDRALRSPPCRGSGTPSGTGRRARSAGLEQRHREAGRRQRPRRLHAGRAAADDGDRARRAGRPRAALELVARPRVDHARHALVEDRAVDARLVAGDADVDRPPAATRPGDRSPGRPGTAAPARRSRRRRPPAAASASSSVLIRFDAITGHRAPASRIARAHGRQAPCGTSSWTVGTRASCQPMPTLSASASRSSASACGERRAPPRATRRRRSGRRPRSGRRRRGRARPPRGRRAATASGNAHPPLRRRRPSSSSRRLVAGAMN